MFDARTHFGTADGSKYLQQLCKHFGHKVPVEFDAETGSISLSAGTARLRTDASGLAIEVTATDGESLDRMKHVIEDHLLRFAFREEPAPLSWTS